jgi:hypothetical protein
MGCHLWRGQLHTCQCQCVSGPPAGPRCCCSRVVCHWLAPAGMHAPGTAPAAAHCLRITPASSDPHTQLPSCCCSNVTALCPLNVASFCIVTANNANFGDPCVNKAKTLTFNYE